MSYVTTNVSGIPMEAREELSAYAKNKKDIVNLAVGNPDLPTPQFIVDGVKKALDEGHTKYTAYHGFDEVNEAICKRIKGKTGLSYNYKTDIIFTHGVQEAIFIAIQALLGQGDDILIPTPHFAPFEQSAYFAQANPILVQLSESDNYTPNYSNINEAITSKTKALIFSNPSNPLGVVWTKDDMEIIANIAKKHDLIVISDEIYDELLDTPYPGSIAELPGMKERTLVLNGFSKTYAMTGLRAGYIAGPEKIIKEIKKLHYCITLCPGSLSQKAALCALTCPRSEIEEINNVYSGRRKILYNELLKIDNVSCVKPVGGLFAYPNFSFYNMDNLDLCKFLIDKAGVLTLPGNTEGGYLRLSICASKQDIIKGVQSIGKALQQILA